MGYMLETRGLTKRFGRGDQAQEAVADVSLHIREGEVYGLLGPNGAGKSTTLKMICGMLRPTAGEILFAGHAWRREDLYAIGSLIEEAPLYPNLTARENLRVRTTLLGLPESRVDEVLAAVDLADTGKKRAGRFSMGMRQRLGLALALIARPRLLVLDEPTNGLDPIGIEELRVGGGLAIPPVLGDRVPVHAVPPRDLAEVRLRAGLPVDVQLSHYVSLHIPLLPGRIPDRSIVPLAQLVKVR